MEVVPTRARKGTDARPDFTSILEASILQKKTYAGAPGHRNRLPECSLTRVALR